MNNFSELFLVLTILSGKVLIVFHPESKAFEQVMSKPPLTQKAF